MRNYKKITVTFILFLAVIFLLPEKVFAQEVWGMDMLDGLNLGTKSIYETIAGIINIALGFLGTIAVGIILYGGFLWMTSAGNPEKVDKAKKALLNGFIGLMIITSAYAIAKFLLEDAIDIINNTGNNNNSNYNATSAGMGAEVLDSHYPAINARNIPRNTNIYVTFTEGMDMTTIVSGANCVDNGDDRTCDADTSHLNVFETVSGDLLDSTDLRVTYDTTNPSGFNINPYADTVDHLGDGLNPIKYTVELSGLLTANAQPAFRQGNIYRWNFTVSTELDITPPTVVSVFPADGASAPLNSIVQVTFSEAVNPIFAAGIYPPFANIALDAGAPINSRLAGAYTLSNQYRTAGFLTVNDCGTNSCGDKMYCLPEGVYDIQGSVNVNITDMAGNHLELPYSWTFGVTGVIETDPPTMINMDGTNNVALDADIAAVFSETLMTNSINGRTAKLTKINPITGLPVAINYWSSATSTFQDNDTILIHHQDFDSNTQYLPKLNSGIKNTTQNCWQPCDCNDPASSSCRCSNQSPNPQNCPGIHCQGSEI